MALKDIIGQEKAVMILRGIVEKGRIPHAFLFAGDDGIGKRLTAVQFAKTMNCSAGKDREGGDMNAGLFFEDEAAPSDSASPVDCCDSCGSCLKIEKRNHPDVFYIEPEGDGDQIKVERIRELEEALSYKPFEGGWKIAVIDSAEKMNAASANALLDTLESPPDRSMLILVSSRPDLLLPTIRSRCQRVNFTPLPLDVMSSLLMKRKKGMDQDQALLLGMLSGGKLGYALNEDLLAQRDRSFAVLKQMLESPGEDVRTGTEQIGEVFDWAQVWLRDIAVLKATGRQEHLINRDVAGDIRAVASGASLKDILKLARELYNIRGKLATVNLNEKLTMNYTGFLLRKGLGRVNAGRDK